MTWFVRDDGYELFFNRDERLSRRRAVPPATHVSDRVAYLSPTDADAGGSWIAANQFGVTVCLLNHYQFEQIETYKAWTSRGEIVRQFADIERVDDVAERFLTLELDEYRAFRMFVIEPSGQNCLCVWDGHAPRIELNVTSPKSSSSVDARDVKHGRKALFDERGLHDSYRSADFIQYHSSHVPSRSKASVCMHRDDAKTVSFSHVEVSAAAISFRYADGSPCQAQLGEPLVLTLVTAPPKTAAIRAIT